MYQGNQIDDTHGILILLGWARLLLFFKDWAPWAVPGGPAPERICAAGGHHDERTVVNSKGKVWKALKEPVLVLFRMWATSLNRMILTQNP